MITLFQKIAYKLARRKFVQNFDRYCTQKKGRALIYNKTEEYLLRGLFQDFSHTNNWESYEMGKIFNELGYIVDIIDRTATSDDIKKIEDKYDLFLGLGVGDSGQFFADIAERVPSATKILYAMGPEPDLSNKITKARHDYFRRRHPDIPIKDRRLILNVNTTRLYHHVDGIITIGNEFSLGSYVKLGKPLYKIYLSTYSKLAFEEADFAKKDPKKFLYFGGNGNITKGLDLVLEIFAKFPDLELYVGAPRTEEDFNRFADPVIEKSPNIHWFGFIDVTSTQYRNLTAECGYVIMPSSSEGCATSVTTCMRRGLIPVVTVESGIEDVEKFGFLVPEGTVEGLEKSIEEAVKLKKDEFIERIQKTYEASSVYTQENFSKTLKKVLTEIISKKEHAE